MNKFRLFCISTLILMIIFLVYEVFFVSEKNFKLISRIIAIIFTYSLVVFRLRFRDGNAPLTIYEAKFSEIIGDSFNNNPGDRKRLLRAIRLLCRKRYKSALLSFEKLDRIAVSSKDHEVIIQFKALCCQNSGQLEDSIQLYESLIKYKPHDSAVLTNLGNLYQKTDKNEKAADIYQKALEYNAESGTIYNNLAYTLLKLNLPKSALINAEKALELDDTLYLSEEVASISNALLSNREESERYYQRCVEHRQDPKNLRKLLDTVWKNK